LSGSAGQVRAIDAGIDKARNNLNVYLDSVRSGDLSMAAVSIELVEIALVSTLHALRSLQYAEGYRDVAKAEVRHV
jgi:hypothetical protein